MAWRIDPTGQMRRARNEFGEFLSRPQWEWFVTQTFKAEYVSPRESDRAWYSWLNGLRVSAKAKGYTPSIYGAAAPFYFRVTEFGDIRFSHNLTKHLTTA